MVLTPERWQHIARIYQLAVDQDPSTRDTFLSEACAGDETLRSEVESLLRQVAVKVLPSSGRKQEAKKLILQLEDTYKDRYFCPYGIGHVYVTLGEIDTAYKLTPLRPMSVRKTSLKFQPSASAYPVKKTREGILRRSYEEADDREHRTVRIAARVVAGHGLRRRRGDHME